MIPILELWSYFLNLPEATKQKFSCFFRVWLNNALWNGDKIMCREKWTMLELENSKERSEKCLLGEKNFYCWNLSYIVTFQLYCPYWSCLHKPTQHGNEEESLNVGREEDGLARGLQSALKQSGHFRGAKPRVRLPDMIGLFNDIFSHSAILSSLYPIYQYFLW